MISNCGDEKRVELACSREVKAQMIEGLKEEINRFEDEGLQIVKIQSCQF